MATTFYKESSSESSHLDGDFERVELGRNAQRHERQEEVEVHGEEGDAETSIDRRKQARSSAPALRLTRSRSLQRSYAGADGYTHFEHEDEEEERHGDRSPGEEHIADEKAFEVAWDGPQASMNPKGDAWKPL